METLTDFFTDYTLRTISMGTFILGALSGMLGSFAVLRKQSLLGDAISHAALPGIVLAFLLVGGKEGYGLLVGALVSGMIGVFWIRGIIINTRLKTDTALGLILSLFFGVGMMLLTYVQQQGYADQAGLDKYLFGQAATLLERDVWVMVAVSFVALIIVLVFWKEFKLVLFDRDYATSLGLKLRFFDILINSLLVTAIVLGLQTVGVVLMSAMLLAPAAAARQWSNKLEVMLLLAAGFGGLAGLIGTGVSATSNNMSTGPVIVLVAIGIVIFSFIFSPKRGLLFRELRFRESRKNLQLNNTLAFMYNIAQTHTDFKHPHAIKLLNNFKGYTRNSLRKLEDKGYISLHSNQWALTKQGFDHAANLYNRNMNDDG